MKAADTKLALMLLTVGGATLSLLTSGYNFGINNNAFHIPIVLQFLDQEQFKSDFFVQSLRKFVSPIYFIFSLISNDKNIFYVFLGGLIITHAVTFLAFLLIADYCGIRNWREKAMVVALVAVNQTIYGYSPVASDGLLLPYFTHTELSQSFALLAIAALLRSRLMMAGVAAGAAFAVNAFVGVWLLAPFTVAIVRYMIRSTRGGPFSSNTVLRSVFAFGMISAPTAIWILLETRGSVVDFDYRTFLFEYYPDHFFISPSNWKGILELAAVAVAALAAAGLTTCRAEARLVLAALIAVFGVGAVVGEWSSNHMLLNLHLLRVDGLIVMFASSLIAVGSVKLMRRSGWTGLSAGALASVSLYATHSIQGFGWHIAVIVMVVARFFENKWKPKATVESDQVKPLILYGTMAASAYVCLSAYVLRNNHQPASPPWDADILGSMAKNKDWAEVHQWARTGTADTAIFLTPPYLEGFRTGAKRRIWVGSKDGATAMWAPETYHEWKSRLSDVKNIEEPQKLIDYACEKGIDYVVLDLRANKQPVIESSTVVYRNEWFEVHAPSCAITAPP